MIQLLLNKTKPDFRLSPLSKVDQSLLRIYEVPPLQKAKSQVIFKNKPIIRAVSRENVSLESMLQIRQLVAFPGHTQSQFFEH